MGAQNFAQQCGVNMSNGPPCIFDREAYRARLKRAARANGDIFLAHEAAAQLALRLDAINRKFERALDLGSRERVFPTFQHLAQTWIRTDLSSDSPSLVAEDDALPFAAESLDLVTSVLGLHAVNDLPGMLAQIRQILKPDGLFVAALFGGETLHELRIAFAAAEESLTGGASPRVAPFADIRNLGGLLQRAGFALPVADVERTTVQYREISRLFRDLRALGETNVLVGRRKSFLSRRVLDRVIQEYKARFSDIEGRFVATFEIIYLTGWAPHESQQKPLQTGSAKARLADALKTEEKKSGDTVRPPRRPN